MIFAMPNPQIREAGAQALWTAPTRDLPLQDWQGLVPRMSRKEKPDRCAPVFLFEIP
jgi:hypothetical protein